MMRVQTPGQSMDMPLRMTGLCLALVFMCSCATQVALRPKLPAETAFVKTTGHELRIILPVHLENGRELLFWADTGAVCTVLDKSLVPLLGNRLRVKTINYNGLGITTNTDVYPAPKLYLGRTPLWTGKKVFTDDLRKFSDDGPLMGILGMDCLRHYCLQLDLAANQVRFLDPDHSENERAGEKFRLMLSAFDGKPRIRANFFGRASANYLIDTGCPDDADLKPKLFEQEMRRLREQTSGQFISSKKMRLSPRVVKHLVAYPSIVFNGEACTNFVLADSPCENLLGLGFLARHVATLNFPKRIMYLQPGSSFPVAADAGEFFSDSSSYALAKEAVELLGNLAQQGRLPGWSKADPGDFNLSPGPDGVAPEPQSVSWTAIGIKKNEPSQYHYQVVHATNGDPWKLQRAWRTDAKDHVVEEYPIP
jgi:hypothetical protein